MATRSKYATRAKWCFNTSDYVGYFVDEFIARARRNVIVPWGGATIDPTMGKRQPGEGVYVKFIHLSTDEHGRHAYVTHFFFFDDEDSCKRTIEAAVGSSS